MSDAMISLRGCRRIGWLPSLALVASLVSFAQSDEALDESFPDTQFSRLDLLVNPVFSADQAEMVYRPLAVFLSERTGLAIEIITPRNFHRYWLDARRGVNPALALEDAHMAAWRMAARGFTPLVTSAESMSFSLLTTGFYADDTLEDFIGRRISSLPAPSLGYVILADWFGNPMQQPLIESNATSWLDAVEIIFSGEADAAMVPNNLVERYPNLYVISQSREFPGLTLSAAPEVPASIRQAVTTAMLELNEEAEHHAALHELDVSAFIAADPEAFRGLERWMSAVFRL